MKIVTGLASLTDDWAFAVVEFFEEDEDDDVSFRAERALERMDERRRRLDKNASEEDEDDPDEDEDEDESEEEDEKEDDSGDEPEEE